MSITSASGVVSTALAPFRGCVAVLQAGDVLIGRIVRELGHEEARLTHDRPGPPRASVTLYRT